jgi:hypothetical protein
MKLIAILSIVIASNFALAETDAELAQRGCIPRRDATTGNISGYDCNVAQENNGKMEMQQLGKPRKVQMKNISSEMQMYNKINNTNEASSTSQEVKNLNEIISKNDLSAKTDLSTLLSQLTLKPIKNPKTGKSLFQVTKIDKGSVWEKSGLKVGDLVTQ